MVRYFIHLTRDTNSRVGENIYASSPLGGSAGGLCHQLAFNDQDLKGVTKYLDTVSVRAAPFKLNDYL